MSYSGLRIFLRRPGLVRSQRVSNQFRTGVARCLDRACDLLWDIEMDPCAAEAGQGVSELGEDLDSGSQGEVIRVDRFCARLVEQSRDAGCGRVIRRSNFLHKIRTGRNADALQPDTIEVAAQLLENVDNRLELGRVHVNP